MALLLATVMVFTPFLKFLFALYQSPSGDRLLNQGNSQYDGPAKSRYLYPLYPPPEIFQVIIFPIKYRIAMHHFGTNPYAKLTSLPFTFSSHIAKLPQMAPDPQAPNAAVLLLLQVFFQKFCLIGCLPRQIQVIASKMPIGCGLLINRTPQIQHFNNSCRTQVKVFPDDFY